MRCMPRGGSLYQPFLRSFSAIARVIVPTIDAFVSSNRKTNLRNHFHSPLPSVISLEEPEGTRRLSLAKTLSASVFYNMAGYDSQAICDTTRPCCIFSDSFWSQSPGFFALSLSLIIGSFGGLHLHDPERNFSFMPHQKSAGYQPLRLFHRCVTDLFSSDGVFSGKSFDE
jgi:hypothetical protein